MLESADMGGQSHLAMPVENPINEQLECGIL
jgi:hypothetical protein